MKRPNVMLCLENYFLPAGDHHELHRLLETLHGQLVYKPDLDGTDPKSIHG